MATGQQLTHSASHPASVAHKLATYNPCQISPERALPFDFVVGILECWSVSWLVIISLIGNQLQYNGVVIYYSFM